MSRRLTVFTPTYNRAYILPRLYESLCGQDCADFVWLIVDDGSTDDTEKIVGEWQREGHIPIVYYRQHNGGKMRAHNKGVELCDTELFMCADSDDVLDSSATISDILRFWDEHSKATENPKVCGLLSYRRMIPEKNGVLVDDLEMCTMADVYDRGFQGETTPVFKTEVVKDYPFPVVDGEKFITEDIVFDRLSLKYRFLLYPHYTQVCEYREDGYTRNGWDVLYNNPKGYRMYYDQLVSNRRPNIIYHMQMYIACSMLAGDGRTFAASSNKFLVLLLYPMGILQYFKLRHRRW